MWCGEDFIFVSFIVSTNGSSVHFQVEGSEDKLPVEKIEEQHSKLVKALQDIFELVTNDMMVHGDRLVNFKAVVTFICEVLKVNLLNNPLNV